VLGNDHDPSVGAAVDSMTALSPHVGEPDRFKGTDDLPDRQVREGWAHAAPGNWKEVTNGVLVTY
jgi:hypothetical protein